MLKINTYTTLMYTKLVLISFLFEKKKLMLVNSWFFQEMLRLCLKL
jgi:hypothetical protein